MFHSVDIFISSAVSPSNQSGDSTLSRRDIRGRQQLSDGDTATTGVTPVRSDKSYQGNAAKGGRTALPLYLQRFPQRLNFVLRLSELAGEVHRAAKKSSGAGLEMHTIIPLAASS